jgi:hypothetical protein
VTRGRSPNISARNFPIDKKSIGFDNPIFISGGQNGDPVGAIRDAARFRCRGEAMTEKLFQRPVPVLVKRRPTQYQPQTAEQAAAARTVMEAAIHTLLTRHAKADCVVWVTEEAHRLLNDHPDCDMTLEEVVAEIMREARVHGLVANTNPGIRF